MLKRKLEFGLSRTSHWLDFTIEYRVISNIASSKTFGSVRWEFEMTEFDCSVNSWCIFFYFTVFGIVYLNMIVANSLWWLSSFNPRGLYYPYAWSSSLCERRTSFCMGLVSRKLCEILTYVFDWLYFTQCLTSFSSINHLLRLYARFLILSRLT